MSAPEAADPAAWLPHRPPFLFIDRIVSLTPGERASARLAVSAAAGWMAGRERWPATLLLEALAQTAGLALRSNVPAGPRLVSRLAAVPRFRMRREVLPGARVILHAERLRVHGAFQRFRVHAETDAGRCAEGELVLWSAAPAAD
ncbi:MAG: 3-hydroxyacyl-[acyl-carrier-protein] dehydratase FabZ [Planctomycetes bacterium]|nr:3-hydroxyacyl-[acyl-carrier-protein] dehydratase FabZ [Planctomycetota bacterium]